VSGASASSSPSSPSCPSACRVLSPARSRRRRVRSSCRRPSGRWRRARTTGSCRRTRSAPTPEPGRPVRRPPDVSSACSTSLRARPRGGGAPPPRSSTRAAAGTAPRRRARGVTASGRELCLRRERTADGGAARRDRGRTRVPHRRARAGRGPPGADAALLPGAQAAAAAAARGTRRPLLRGPPGAPPHDREPARTRPHPGGHPRTAVGVGAGPRHRRRPRRREGRDDAVVPRGPGHDDAGRAGGAVPGRPGRPRGPGEGRRSEPHHGGRRPRHALEPPPAGGDGDARPGRGAAGGGPLGGPGTPAQHGRPRRDVRPPDRRARHREHRGAGPRRADRHARAAAPRCAGHRRGRIRPRHGPAGPRRDRPGARPPRRALIRPAPSRDLPGQVGRHGSVACLIGRNTGGMVDDARWKARFRAARMSLPRWARDAPSRSIYRSNVSGTWEIYTWDRDTGAQRQVTDRPNGTWIGAIDPSGEWVWWFADTDGDEFGVWNRVPFDAEEGAESVPAVPDLEPSYPAGLCLGRTGLAVVGRSADDGTTVHLCQAGAAPEAIYHHAEDAHVAALSRGESLIAIGHSEHGDSRHMALRVVRPDGATVADLWDGPGKGVYAAGFAPVEGD